MAPHILLAFNLAWGPCSCEEFTHNVVHTYNIASWCVYVCVCMFVCGHLFVFELCVLFVYKQYRPNVWKHFKILTKFIYNTGNLKLIYYNPGIL